MVGPGGYALSFLLAWMLAQIQAVPRTIIALAIYTPSMLGQVFIGVIWKTIFSGDQRGIINNLLMKLDVIDQPIQFLLTKDYFMEIMMSCPEYSGVGFAPESVTPIHPILNAFTIAITAPKSICGFIDGMVM